MYLRATQRFNIDVEPLIEQLVERGKVRCFVK